jgi:hypothetical protein
MAEDAEMTLLAMLALPECEEREEAIQLLTQKSYYVVVTKGAGTCKRGERSDLTGCTPASGEGGGGGGGGKEQSEDNNSDPAYGRPSKKSERHPDAAPKALPYQAPPPKKGKKGQPIVRGKGAESQTARGDIAESLASKLGFRSILPPGQRCNKPGENKEKGSTIDLEFDHSGKAYELKMCQTSATEYRLKAKASEKEAKYKYAELNDLQPYTLVGVRDVDTGEVHFYASKEAGLTGAEVSDKAFDYVGTVKESDL